MRTTASKETAEPSAFCAVTATVRGVVPSLSAVRPVMVKVSVPSRPRDSALCPAGNWRGTTPMPMRLERWMRSKDSAMTALTPSRAVPLAAQSREEPEPYSLPPRTTSGMPAAW